MNDRTIMASRFKAECLTLIGSVTLIAEDEASCSTAAVWDVEGRNR
ncbi:MAG TPA: hypothetical protein VM427_11075 [Patescibacteria group bacterium]|nr:hypothetical protein [Patescibacteria group bacterium]